MVTEDVQKIGAEMDKSELVMSHFRIITVTTLGPHAISVLLHTACCSAIFFKDKQIWFLSLHDFLKENFFLCVCVLKLYVTLNKDSIIHYIEKVFHFYTLSTISELFCPKPTTCCHCLKINK